MVFIFVHLGYIVVFTDECMCVHVSKIDLNCKDRIHRTDEWNENKLAKNIGRNNRMDIGDEQQEEGGREGGKR